MSNDPRIKWELPSPHGFLINEAQDAWGSGHVEDVLELDGGDSGLLVATQTGGVWMVAPDNSALPLSDNWDVPDINTLAAGPDGPRHFFAGGGKVIEKNLTAETPPIFEGAIYETDASHPVPLLSWKPVDAPLPRSAGQVNSILVLRRHRMILAACERGLYWSEIPESSPQRGCLSLLLSPTSTTARQFNWRRADEVDVGQGGYFSVVAGSLSGLTQAAGEEDLSRVSIIAGGLAAGIFIGQWDAGNVLTGKLPNFHLKRVSVIDPLEGDVTDSIFPSTDATSVAVCEQFPTTLYAACSEPDGRLKAVLKSRDGGRRWEKTGFTLEGVAAAKDIRIAAGDQGDGWNNCIAVLPSGPGVVAFGWVHGVFISHDGGRNWRMITGNPAFGKHVPHLHVDLHVVRFKTTLFDNKHYLYIGSDGGLALVDLDEFALTGQVSARSNFNRLLPTIQCYATYGAGRQLYGTLAASRLDRGWVSAGTQDNGNLYSNLAAGSPWLVLDEGDGGWNAFLEDGALVRNVVHNYVFSAHRQAGAIVGKGSTPITVPPPGDPKGLKSTSFVVGDIVRRPRFRNEGGFLMYAVAGAGPNIYGLFTDVPHPMTYHWELLGTLSPDLTVTGLTSHTGSTVFVGTDAGRIFALDSRRAIFQELAVVLPKPMPNQPQKGGNACRIVTLSETSAFAILNATDQKNNYVLRLDGLKWSLPLCAGLPVDQFFYGLEGVLQEDRQVLFAATDERVYMSEDAGDHWVPASANLPRRPHCADLRVVIDQEEAWLYLSTFGRSVWRARLHRVRHG
jgi:hypothetical protein